MAAVGALALGTGLLAMDVASAAKTPSGHPTLLIGLDGGEWTVIRDLWTKGQLPALKALADKGVSESLVSYYGQSPIIWTSIATGHSPDVHGITGFVVATPEGDVPVSSTVRRVPAIWNIASAAGLHVNVLGWWGSWPAEEINGIDLTEKAQYDQPRIVHPASMEPEIKAALPGLNDEFRTTFPGKGEFAPEDRVMAHFAPEITAKGFDLQLMYLHGTDPNSHKYWKYYRPSDFPGEKIDLEVNRKLADKVPKAYRSVDAVIGEVVANAPKDANIIIVSDHGFRPLDRTYTKVVMEMDDVLAQLGWVTVSGGEINFSQTKAWNYGTRKTERDKRVRFNVKGRDPEGIVAESDIPRLRKELEADLARFTYTSGKPVFQVSDPTPRDLERGADLVVTVLDIEPSREIILDGKTTLDGIVTAMVENSGGHDGAVPGVFIATGPDIDPKADVSGISILDITPTLLYATGLPVAKDMAGKPYTQLFTKEFQAANPLKTVDSYGKREATGVEKAGDNDQMLDELRALGYID